MNTNRQIHRSTLSAVLFLVSAVVAVPAQAQTLNDLYPETAMVLAADGALDDAFGYDVSLSGDTLAVGLAGDDVVNAADLALLLTTWGPCTGSCRADLDGNGSVGAADLAALLVS